MIERVLAISIRTGLLDLIIFLNEISSYCGTFGTKLLKSRLWNCKIRTLDWTLREIEHGCCLLVFATANLYSLQGTKPGLQNQTSITGPGCSKANYLNPGLAQTFVSCFQLFGHSFLCLFFFSRLTSSNVKFY